MSEFIKMRDRRQFSGLLSPKWTASIKPTERKSWTGPKSLALQDIPLFQASTKAPAELFAYRVVLNGIAWRVRHGRPYSPLTWLTAPSSARGAWCGRILRSLRTSIDAEPLAAPNLW